MKLDLVAVARCRDGPQGHAVRTVATARNGYQMECTVDIARAHEDRLMVAAVVPNGGACSLYYLQAPPLGTAAATLEIPRGPKGSGVWDLHPPGRLHRPECCWLHHHLVLRTAVKWILRPESHRHGLLYERSALLALPRRNQAGAPARTCTSTLRLRTATCTALTPRELMIRNGYVMPVLPRPVRFGRPPCALLHQ